MKNRITLCLIVLAFAGCRKTTDAPQPTPTPPDVPVVNEVGLIITNKTFPTISETFTLYFDATKGNAALSAFSGEVYLYAGVITAKSAHATDWKFIKSPSFNTADAAAKMTKQANGQYAIDIDIKNFFGIPDGEEVLKMVMLFRSADGSVVARNKDGSDIYLPVYVANTLGVRFIAPELTPAFVPQPVLNVAAAGSEITVTAIASQAANLVLSLNNTPFATAAHATQITGKTTLTAAGMQTIKVRANNSVEASYNLMTAGTVVVAELPAGAKQGVTFINEGSAAIFALYAPEKPFVHVIGDFNNWTPDAASAMKRTPDGKIWWVQIDGLNPSKEYAYQYWVGGSIKIADPYTEKILDPDNDAAIPAGNYANVGTYPTGKTTGIVSTMLANAPTYDWKNTRFTRPDKKNVVIYELLLRDFLQNNHYAMLTDTLNYLSRLGVNAIELMPITEFEGNVSWGYNPSFYFAPDKYYGSKYQLQRFIDECHSRGIAVIMDMVLNHSFGQSPMVQLYFDGTKPVNNPWYNSVPTHPYNVGYDFNHESSATKSFVKDVLRFWMKEYKIDGFRFDLSKGFTQTNYGTSDAAVAQWSAYDAGRVAIWKEYNNYIKSIDGDNFYVILEHFAADNEEQELAAEGMLFWNNINHSMNEATMGWLAQSDFSRGIFTTHTFTRPDYLVTYLESHDEERLMYKNISYGNANATYNIKNINTALKRQEMAAAFLLAMPGPKMLWQFEELGYDVSINHNGRTGQKPPHWEYDQQQNRVALKQAVTSFINFKKKNSIFQTTSVTYSFGGGIKYMVLQDAGNTVVVVGNFDIIDQEAHINFGTAGMWYDAAHAHQAITLADNTYRATLAPGAYHMYTKQVLIP